jgi:hypothetical protein
MFAKNAEYDPLIVAIITRRITRVDQTKVDHQSIIDTIPPRKALRNITNKTPIV